MRPDNTHFAEGGSASARFQDRLFRQPALARLHQPEEFADGRGLADADTADEGDSVFTGEEECGEPAQFLIVEVHPGSEGIDQIGIRSKLSKLSQREVRFPEDVSVGMVEIRAFDLVPVLSVAFAPSVLRLISVQPGLLMNERQVDSRDQAIDARRGFHDANS